MKLSTHGSRIVLSVALVCFSLISATTSANASAADHIDQALQRLFGKADGVMSNPVFAKKSYGLSSIFGDFLKKGRDTREVLGLEKGRSYLIMGAGDDDCTNVDISIEDSRGRVIEKDNSLDNSPFVLFSPPVNGDYTAKIKIEGMRPGVAGSFCALMLLGNNLYRFSSAQMISSATALKEQIKQAQKTWPGSGFLTTPSSYSDVPSLRGVAVANGAKFDWPTYVSPGRHGFVGSGAPDVGDMDMNLTNAKGDVVAENTNAGNAPSFAYTSPRGGTFHNWVYNNASSRPAILWIAGLSIPNK